MDYKTARSFLIDQGSALEIKKNPDAFLMRLQQGLSPVPGQVTSILLALKILFEGLQESPMLSALHLLSVESLQQFEAGLRRGVSWPPLLKEDLNRIAIAVRNIFSGVWK
jgi:hypothetical protein